MLLVSGLVVSCSETSASEVTCDGAGWGLLSTAQSTIGWRTLSDVRASVSEGDSNPKSVFLRDDARINL